MRATTLGGRLDPAAARREFPATERYVYLDVASRAPMADRVSAALTDYMTTYRHHAVPKDDWLARVETVRARVARLMGAAPAEIAFTKSTSDGLNTLAHALGLAAGDNVVVCPDLEHANNVYPWLHLRDLGVEVRAVPADGSRYPVEDMLRGIDGRTRVVTVSSVSFVTGARAPLRRLADACREQGVFLLVDGVQELGAMRMDMAELGIDGLAAATQKMLLGMYGLGVLYCHGAWLDRLRPPFLTRMGVDWGGGHEADLDVDGYRLAPGAARFEVGNPNFAGVFALDAALSLIEDVTPAVIEDHVLRLATRLRDGIAGLGFDVRTPAARGERAGIVTFTAPDAPALHERLEREGVRVALRRGALRASVHVYNDDGDIDTFLDLLRHATTRETP